MTDAEDHIKWIDGYISLGIKPIDIIPGTKVQYNKQRLITLAFLTLTKGQGHTSRSKDTDVEVSAFSECFLFS